MRSSSFTGVPWVSRWAWRPKPTSVLHRPPLTPDLNQMVPGTAARRGPDMPASKWLMEMDAWTKDKYADSLDICMNGVVVGVLEV